MQQRDSRPQIHVSGSSGRASVFRGATAVLAAGLTLASFATEGRANGGDEIPFSAVTMIIETNASDCDSGIQIFFDGDAWKNVKIVSPLGRTIFDVRLKGSLNGFGLTEHFNESMEPPMEELVSAYPELECDEPEFTLAEFFELFPQGSYEFGGTTVEGDRLEGEAAFSHVIPASPEIVAPAEGVAQDPNNTVIEWLAVTDPILPSLGPIEIVAYQVIVATLAGPRVAHEVSLTRGMTGLCNK